MSSSRHADALQQEENQRQGQHHFPPLHPFRPSCGRRETGLCVSTTNDLYTEQTILRASPAFSQSDTPPLFVNVRACVSPQPPLLVCRIDTLRVTRLEGCKVCAPLANTDKSERGHDALLAVTSVTPLRRASLPLFLPGGSTRKRAVTPRTCTPCTCHSHPESGR